MSFPELHAHYGHTHQGPHFQINEDVFFSDIQKGLFGIIDAFGGTGIGDVLAKYIKDQLSQLFHKMTDDDSPTMPFSYNPQLLLEGNALLNSVHYLHEELYKKNSSLPIQHRGGASLLAMALGENSCLNILSIGNVVLYLYRDGHLSPVILPDTISFFSGFNGGKKDCLYPRNAIGLFHPLYYQYREVSLKSEDRLCVLSHGVYPFIAQEMLASLLSKKKYSLREKVSILMEEANKSGNINNQTILLLDF